MSEYSSEELSAIYELGRVYFEMGYFVPAERIFAGLAAVDAEQIPARLALGLIKLEQGLVNEAVVQFRLALEAGGYELETKLALGACFISAGETQRVQSILAEVGPRLDAGASARDDSARDDLRNFYLALSRRVRAG